MISDYFVSVSHRGIVVVFSLSCRTRQKGCLKDPLHMQEVIHKTQVRKEYDKGLDGPDSCRISDHSLLSSSPKGFTDLRPKLLAFPSEEWTTLLRLVRPTKNGRSRFTETQHGKTFRDFIILACFSWQTHLYHLCLSEGKTTFVVSGVSGAFVVTVPTFLVRFKPIPEPKVRTKKVTGRPTQSIQW